MISANVITAIRTNIFFILNASRNFCLSFCNVVILRRRLFDSNLEAYFPGRSLIAGIACRLYLDCDLVGALLKALFDRYLSGLLVDCNLLIAGYLCVCQLSLAFLGKLDYLADTESLSLLL